MTDLAKLKSLCKEDLCIVIIWLVWYVLTAISTITNKSLLLVFSHPLTATVNQLFHTSLYGYFLSRAADSNSLKEVYDEVKSDIRSFILLGFLNGFAIGLFHFGMSMLTASYLHTVKTAVPIFVVILSKFFGKHYSYKTYISLLIIMSGVAVTSKTEVSFSLLGLVISLLSTMGTAAFSVYMKMILTSSKLNTFNILYMVSIASLLWILPVWAVTDVRFFIRSNKNQLLLQLRKASYLFVLDGVARCLQNLAAIVMLSRLSALGYSVASVVKRLFVILTAILFFATPASPYTFVGLALALIGLLMYNLIKDEPASKDTPKAEANEGDGLSAVIIDTPQNHVSTRV